jgi:two-component system, NarL family, nitrate/nitrite response regulator NarL
MEESAAVVPLAATVRIVVVDDHPIVRYGLRALFEAERGFQVVGEAGDGAAAVDLVAKLLPDIVLLDASLPRMSGLDVLCSLRDRGLSARSVLLTAADERPDIVKALELGARGAIAKESATELMTTCVRRVMAGEYWIGRGGVADVIHALREASRPAPASAQDRRRRLTPREQAVAAAVVEGLCNKTVATRLNVSEQTVKNHLRSIFEKLGVTSRLELAVYALANNLVPAPEKAAAERAKSA